MYKFRNLSERVKLKYTRWMQSEQTHSYLDAGVTTGILNNVIVPRPGYEGQVRERIAKFAKEL